MGHRHRILATSMAQPHCGQGSATLTSRMAKALWFCTLCCMWTHFVPTPPLQDHQTQGRAKAEKPFIQNQSKH